MSKVNVTVTINVDYDPAETSWQIKDDADASIVERIGMGSYLDRCREYVHTIELTYERSYTFTITDSFGDGMSKVCDANYTVSVVETNETLAFGDGFSFTSSRSQSFQVEQPPSSSSPSSSPSISLEPSIGVSSDSPSMTPTFIPSAVPTISNEPSLEPPSDKPSARPTFVPSSVPTKTSSVRPSLRPSRRNIHNTIPYILVLYFDQNPEETSWKLVPNIIPHYDSTASFRQSSNHQSTSHQQSIVMYGEPFGHYRTPCTREKIQLHLIEGLSYTFTIYDQKGNGMRNECPSSNIKGSRLPGYSLYTATTTNVETLVLQGDGYSFTDVKQEIINVPLLRNFINCNNSPSNTPSIRSLESNIPSSAKEANAVDILTVVKVGAIGASTAVASVFILVSLFILVKMFTMRQKGKPVPHLVIQY